MSIEMYNKHYSMKEAKLMEAFSMKHLCDIIDVPPSLFRICVEQAFINNMQGEAVESLRRIYKACINCNPYRLTPEFEALIEVK